MVIQTKRRLRRLCAALWTLGGLLATGAAADEVRPHAAMMRNPDVSATHIVFSYANDLWLVERAGGEARPLASPEGIEGFPRFSPDGETVAFAANYDGNSDLYTLPVAGGVPHRVTYHPAGEILCDWTPAGELLFFADSMGAIPASTQLFTVSADGGLPEQLPVPYGANGAISPDGKWLAYTPHTRDHRTWKRYRGGMATDIWLFHLTRHTSKKITDWEGTDSQPMWHGKNIYYLSDAGPNHRLNIWVYDTKSKKRKQITRFKDYDVKWPAIGPGSKDRGEIVFQNGSALYLLDLKTRKSRAVDVTIPGDRPKIRPQRVDVSRSIAGGDISATGKRAVVEARGDIWTLPAKDGAPRNLTRTSGVAERDPAWSPDGRWIAYFSDETGEYQLYITQSDGKGETRQLTKEGTTFRFNPSWSPDSKHVTFGDKTGALYLYTLESEELKHIVTDPWSDTPRPNWSHDSAWLAYAMRGEQGLWAIWLYDLASDEHHQVTSGAFTYTWPTFDREGKYLFCASNQDFSGPLFDYGGVSYAYVDTDRLLVIPLRQDIDSPFAPKSDEEEWDDEEGEEDSAEDEATEDEESADEGDEEALDDAEGPVDEESAEDDEGEAAEADESETDDDDEGAEEEADEDENDEEDEGEKEDEEEEEPLKIDLEGFEARAILLPVPRGGFFNLAVNDKGQLLYMRTSARGDDGASIHLFDLTDEKREQKTVLAGVRGFAISADGKKLLVGKGRQLAIIDAAAGQKMDKPIALDGMTAVISPREEWRQIFHEVWRLYRDYFYDPNMHGVDWDGIREHYGKMLADCVTRENLSFLIREMIAELNVGHAYYWGQPSENGPRVSVGMLGCDFARDNGAYQISKIYHGGAWDADARGPLSQPNVDVKEGDYLLAVNAVPLDVTKAPWAALQGLADKVVTITVSEKPQPDDDARDVIVRLLPHERDLRFRAWVENNRACVDEKSAGKVGYIYVPDTFFAGRNELARQYYGQWDKQALIVDGRWNAGGISPDRFVELLGRRVTHYWAPRDGKDDRAPNFVNPGPKCMLINGLAGSGGDMFPALFRLAGIGKLVGTRTWGGLVGLSGNPSLIDGAQVTVPRVAYYETDGTWGIEGHGVDPDIEVIDDPALMVDGGDPQLDAAIGLMLEEIEQNGYKPPKRPAYSDRSGMGIREEDK
jgi:tricorn protease